MTDRRGGAQLVVHVLPHAGGGAESFIDLLERLPGFMHQRCYLSSGRNPSDALSSIPLTLPRLAARMRTADLVQTHGDVATVLASPLLRVRPSVMTCQGLHMLRRVTGPRRLLFETALAFAVSQCRVVVCSSKAERSDLERIVRRADGGKLWVVDNAVDRPPAVDHAERRSIRDGVGVSDKTVLGMFVGQLEARKAPLLAARAAVRVHEAGMPFVLALAGDGPEAAAVEALNGPAVRTLGFRADVHQLLAAADVFVQSSEREGMSFALLEAMAHGLPIVATYGPGNPEAVGDGGLLFPAGDEDGLVAALMRVCGEPSLRHATGANARSRAFERFSVERFLASTEQVYRRALSSSSTAALDQDAGVAQA